MGTLEGDELFLRFLVEDASPDEERLTLRFTPSDIDEYEDAAQELRDKAPEANP